MLYRTNARQNDRQAHCEVVLSPSGDCLWKTNDSFVTDILVPAVHRSILWAWMVDDLTRNRSREFTSNPASFQQFEMDQLCKIIVPDHLRTRLQTKNSGSRTLEHLVVRISKREQSYYTVYSKNWKVQNVFVNNLCQHEESSKRTFPSNFENELLPEGSLFDIVQEQMKFYKSQGKRKHPIEY